MDLLSTEPTLAALRTYAELKEEGYVVDIDVGSPPWGVSFTEGGS